MLITKKTSDLKLLTYLLVFLSLNSLAQEDYSYFTKSPDINLLDTDFMKHPSISIGKDTVHFIMKEDSTIVANCVSLLDTNALWIYYKDMALNDFWEVYLRDKYNQGWAGRKEHELFPRKYIQEFFSDKNIELLDLYIYSSTLGSKSFNECGSCYSGTDFLFKIYALDYQRLCYETWTKYTLLPIINELKE